MVSIVLLTTEEVLQRNSFWYCLDAAWITEELEPFEEVKPEHLYSKPLTRDIYYAKFPEIPRSESEDENSLSINGFKTKHCEWKSNICLKRYHAQKRDSRFSNSSNSSINNKSSRATSLVDPTTSYEKRDKRKDTNDERVRHFFKRLLESVPPPPIEDLYDTGVVSFGSLLLPNIPNEDFSDITVPDYTEFEKGTTQDTMEQSSSPATSTLKKAKRKVTFKVETNHCDSWYESLYGLSDLDNLSEYEIDRSIAETDYPSWSDIVMECGVSNSVLFTKEINKIEDKIISQSHSSTYVSIKLPQDDDDEDDETGYARFAVYKIHQSLKLLGEGMSDSSPMKDFCEDIEDIHTPHSESNCFADLYRLAPHPSDIIDEPVNKNNPDTVYMHKNM